MPGIMNHPEAQRKSPGLHLLKSSASLLWNLVLDLTFPPQCSGCRVADTRWCGRCMNQLEGLALLPHQRQINPSLLAAATGQHSGKLQQAIHAFKYAGAPELAEALAWRMKQLWEQLVWPADLLIPVPVHAARLQERGYNQSELLADHLGKMSGLPVNSTTIIRQRNTSSQVGLTSLERKHNVSGAFGSTASLTGTRIILVDDVLTTGATLVACAQAAYNAGAKAVYGLTVATATSLIDR